jgi:hypothetical protein
MVEAQELTHAHAINVAFAHNLPEAKRVPLLAVLMCTGFEDLFPFRDQVTFFARSIDRISPNLISYRDLTGALSCYVGSIEFQINRLHTQVRPNGHPRLLTLEAYLTITKLVNYGFQAHSPVSMIYISGQILRLFGISDSLNTLSHLIRQMSDMKTVDGIPMEGARVMTDAAAIDAYYAKIAELIDRVPREFVLSWTKPGLPTMSTQGKRELSFRQHICMRRFLSQWIGSEAINIGCWNCRRRCAFRKSPTNINVSFDLHNETSGIRYKHL